jgi:hypothetical protein
MRNRRTRRNSVRKHAASFGLSPTDYGIGSMESRAAARAMADANREVSRMIFCGWNEPLKLETSSCQRMLWPDGLLVEVIFLDGRIEDLTEDELDAFVNRFPIRDDR